MSLGINGNNYDRWQISTDAVGNSSQTKSKQNASNDSVEIGGDLYQPSTETEDLEAELGALQETVGANETSNVGATTGANSTANVSNEELEDKKDELDANRQRMEAIQDEIEDLSDEAAKTIEEAISYQEAAVAEQKEETQKAIKEQIQAYVDANKNGEGMTREELQTNIQAALPNSPNLSSALSKVLQANEQISEIDGLLGELKCLLTSSADLQDEIDALEAAGAGSNKCCDPIGFVSNGTEFNFFTDSDGDGKLSQTNEFLGAENQWAEMQAADDDGNGTVTAEELEANNIFLAGMDGSVIKDAQGYKDAFGADFSIDLNSYTEGGTHSAVDATADADNDGTLDQQLLGTFNVNANGSTIQGYNTLDDVDWLQSKYGVENSAEGAQTQVGTTDSGLLDTSNLGDLQAFGEFYNTAYQQNQLAKEKLAGVEEAIGFTGDEVEAYKAVEASRGEQKAQQFVDSVEITPRVRETKAVGSNTTSNGQYNAERGQSLVDSALKMIEENGETMYYCATGVSNTFKKWSMDVLGYTEKDALDLGGDGCDWDTNMEQLVAQGLFVEATGEYPSASDLSSLPAGAVVCWEASGDGTPGGTYGHVTIADGNGGEISDHHASSIYTEIGGRSDTYRIFLPV